MHDLCQQQTRLNLLQKQRFEQEHLSSLLAPEPATQLAVNVFQLLCAHSGVYRLKIPVTLVVDETGVWLLHNKPNGTVQCQTQFGLAFGLQSLSRHLPATHPPYPVLVHKSSIHPPAFLSHLPSVVPPPSLLQEYIKPQCASSTLIKAHWKQSTQSTVYYIVNRKNMRPATAMPRSHHFPDTSQADIRFHISEKRFDCGFVKRVKPYPAVDFSVSEVRRLLEHTALQPGQGIKELVCDYVLDSHKLPVFLKCEGFSLTSNLRFLTRTISPTFVNMEMVDSLCESMPKPEVNMSVTEMSDKRENATRASTEIPRNRVKLKNFQRKYTPTPNPEAVYLSGLLSACVSKYDGLRNKIKAYRQEQRDSINFVEKYKGRAFWRPILVHIAEIFREDATLKQYYDHLNFEESEMLLRGYERILEGNFSIYYKKSMVLIHTGKGINPQAFQAFVNNVQRALKDFAIPSRDCEIIIDRFRSMESCICPEGN